MRTELKGVRASLLLVQRPLDRVDLPLQGVQCLQGTLCISGTHPTTEVKAAQTQRGLRTGETQTHRHPKRSSIISGEGRLRCGTPFAVGPARGPAGLVFLFSARNVSECRRPSNWPNPPPPAFCGRPPVEVRSAKPLQKKRRNLGERVFGRPDPSPPKSAPGTGKLRLRVFSLGTEFL